MCNDGDVEYGMDFPKVSVSRYASISGKRPAQPALPCMAGCQTANASSDDERLQDHGANMIADGLIE